jgi:predicted TIM-barrel fold metal-dependent hydrolase
VVSAIANATLGTALARAANDWVREEWLERDDRLAAGIAVSGRDAVLAAGEIERLAGEPRFVQVTLAYPPGLLSDWSLRPLFAAAAEAGLPVCLEATGAFTGGNRGLTRVGFPTTPWEYEQGWIAAAQPHLTSAIAEGLFERFDGLRLVLHGFGAAWIPSLFWRLDEAFTAPSRPLPKGLRSLPSATLRERVRLSTWRLERPGEPGRLRELLRLADAESMLVYASGDELLTPAGEPLAGVHDLYRFAASAGAANPVATPANR